jgi:peptidylamidoglycolate lyase
MTKFMTRTVSATMATLALASCQAHVTPREQVQELAADKDWPSLAADVRLGEVSAVDVDPDGNIWLLHRPGRPWQEPFPRTTIPYPTVLKLAPDGTMLARWGAGKFIMPHGLSIDSAGKIWITDVAREQIFRFSPDGRQELVLGEKGITRQDANHFGRPADIAFLGDHVLVADGYVNTRVAEFDQHGQFVRDWGSFKIAHAIAVDETRIYVADRENARIQIFDHAGKLVENRRSPNGNHSYGLKTLGQGRLLAVEGRDGADRSGAILRIYGPDGNVEASFDVGLAGDGNSLGHDVAVGRDGYVFVADVPGHRLARVRLPEAMRYRD